MSRLRLNLDRTRMLSRSATFSRNGGVHSLCSWSLPGFGDHRRRRKLDLSSLAGLIESHFVGLRVSTAQHTRTTLAAHVSFEFSLNNKGNYKRGINEQASDLCSV